MKQKTIENPNSQSFIIEKQKAPNGVTLSRCVIDEIEVYDPNDIAIAVIHNKIKHKVYKLPKQYKYFAGEDILDEWIVYPWEQTKIDL